MLWFRSLVGSSFNLELGAASGVFGPPESPPGEDGWMDGWMDGLEARRKDSSNKPLRGTTSTQGCGVDVYQRAAMREAMESGSQERRDSHCLWWF